MNGTSLSQTLPIHSSMHLHKSLLPDFKPLSSQVFLADLQYSHTYQLLNLYTLSNASGLMQGLHSIDYDDGDQEELDLNQHTWHLMSDLDSEELVDDGGLDQLHSAAEALAGVCSLVLSEFSMLWTRNTSTFCLVEH